MIFDAISFGKYVMKQLDLYQAYVFTQLAETNPTWIEDLKNDKTLLRNDLTEDEVKEQIEKVLSNPNFVKYEANWDTVKEFFEINDEKLKQFWIDK